jgi:hypothetical protein
MVASMTTAEDAEFAQWTAHMATLAARGDIAAFEIPGDVDVTPQGQARFTQALLALAGAALTQKRRATLRWRFDPPGSDAAQRRTNTNVTLLLPAIQAAAVALHHGGHSLQALVAIEFVDVGLLPPALVAALQQQGIVAPGAVTIPAATSGPAPEHSTASLTVWDTSDSGSSWLGEYQVGPHGAHLVEHESMHPTHANERRLEMQRAGQRLGTTVGGFAIWTLGETGEIWTKDAFPASGPRTNWRIGRTRLDASGANAVIAFMNRQDYGHRGVKLRLRSGRELMIVEERDTAAQFDPSYNLDNALIDGAWAVALGCDLAAWLGIKYEEESLA